MLRRESGSEGEPELIIPTTIPKFTAVDRNVFPRGTKYTAGYPRVASRLLLFLLFFIFSPFSLLLFATTFFVREHAREYQTGTKVLPELESPHRGMNFFALYPFFKKM